jgi:hypothetical protein
VTRGWLGWTARGPDLVDKGTSCTGAECALGVSSLEKPFGAFMGSWGCSFSF